MCLLFFFILTSILKDLQYDDRFYYMLHIDRNSFNRLETFDFDQFVTSMPLKHLMFLFFQRTKLLFLRLLLNIELKHES